MWFSSPSFSVLCRISAASHESYFSLIWAPHLWHFTLTFTLVYLRLASALPQLHEVALALFIFPDFEKRGCNTWRNQEVAALILFPQAPDPTTGGAYSISNITLHLLFIKIQEKKEREKRNSLEFAGKKKKILMKKLKYDSLFY